MKANSRRRVLISSMAMLLVALVALSTATFAWFTTSTTTTANGLNVKTIKSSELVISKSDREWKQTIDYSKNNQVLRPVSSADGSNWYSATAASKLASTMTGSFSSVGTEKDSYVFVEELNVANRGKADVTNVTISVANFTNNYGRIALVEVDADGNFVGEYENYAEAFQASIYDTEDEGYAAANGTASSATVTIDPSNNLSITIPKLEGKADDAADDAIGGAKYYDLYVWFEGQDTDCYDTNAGQSIGNITFSVAGTTKTQ